MNKIYTWNTPNGQKPVIMLEELGVEYDLRIIDIRMGEQHSPEFLAINPNAKIPALEIDDKTVFESGAILLHLAQVHQKFFPASGQEHLDTLAWTFWQVGGLGPMIGQWGHFLSADETLPYAIERYLSETLRLFSVLDVRLSQAPYLGGSSYTIADIMSFPWAKGGLKYLEGAAADRLPKLPNVRAWVENIDRRPAVKTAFARLETAAAKRDV